MKSSPHTTLRVSFEDTSRRCLYATTITLLQPTIPDPVTQETVIPFNMYHDVSLSLLGFHIGLSYGPYRHPTPNSFGTR